jgi:hypothetical protein
VRLVITDNGSVIVPTIPQDILLRHHAREFYPRRVAREGLVW